MIAVTDSIDNSLTGKQIKLFVKNIF